MRRDYNLFEKISSFQALYQASTRAWKGRKNQKGLEALRFMCDRQSKVLALRQALVNDTWQPGELRAFVIRDPKLRLICAAPFEDRVVHHALCHGIGPRIERALSPHSHACRVGFGTHSALKSAQKVAKAYPFILRLDVAHYFETIPHDLLCERFHRLFKEPKLLRLIEIILRHPTPFGNSDYGLPIGSLTSQHAANLFLSELDHTLKRSFTLGYVRYMDDLVIGVRTKTEAWAIHDFVHHHLEHLGLKLKPSATLLSPAHIGFNFLGFRLWPYRIRLDGTRRRRFIRKVIRIKTQQNKPSIHREDLDQYQAQIQGLNAWAAIAHSRGFRASVWARHAPFIDT